MMSIAERRALPAGEEKRIGLRNAARLEERCVVCSMARKRLEETSVNLRDIDARSRALVIKSAAVALEKGSCDGGDALCVERNREVVDVIRDWCRGGSVDSLHF